MKKRSAGAKISPEVLYGLELHRQGQPIGKAAEMAQISRFTLYYHTVRKLKKKALKSLK